MKTFKISFLFFYAVVITIHSICNYNLHAQNSSDSTEYHIQHLKEIKNIDDAWKAIHFFKNTSTLFLNRKDSVSAAYHLEILAFGYFKIGDVHNSETTAIDAYSILNKISDTLKTLTPRTRLLNQLGILYKQKKDYANALNYYAKALQINTVLKNKISIINNISNIYAEKGQYQTAVTSLNHYYNDVLLLENSSEKATYLNNLGYYQSKLKIPNALKKMKHALSIRKEKGDLVGLFSSYHYLILYFKDRNKKKEALKYISKALQVASQLNSASFKLEALKLKLSLNNDTTFNDYIVLNERILNEKQLQDNKYAAIKYDVEKEREKINTINLKLKTTEVEKLEEQSKRILYQTMGLLTIAFALFLYFIIRSKHKKDKIQHVYKTETQLSKKVHDELANDMSDLINFVEHNTDINDSKKALLLDNIEDIYLRTRDISTQTGSIDLENYQASIKHLLMQHNKQNTKVLIHNVGAIEWHNVAEHKKMVIYRCLQELMVNMKKHSNAKMVSIAFKNHGKKKEIRYVDDGIGCDPINLRRNGLLNVESRIKGIGGSFNFKTSMGDGFKASIEFTA